MFEGMLARKYIGAQKRHSALTVCSIAIALALIVMLFTLFSTGINILRNIAYSQGEYHIKMEGTINGYAYTKAEYDALEKAAGEYGTCTPEQLWISGELAYHANIMLNKKIDSASLVVDRIGKKAGIDREKLSYQKNELLMTLDVMDADAAATMSEIIAAFYVFVLFLIMMLRLIIDTAFEVSSRERERQFGVLQSIGATPKQIVRIITYEGLMLSVIGIPIGTALGIGLGYLAYRGVLGTGLADLYLSPEKAAELVHFSVNPWLTLLGIVTGAVWVFLSAYGTGMRVVRMSPVQAISQRANNVKKVGKASLFGKLFGWRGKLASRNNMRQPKRFIVTVVSLTLSIAIFSSVSVMVSDLRSAAAEANKDTGIDSDFTVISYYSLNENGPFFYRSLTNTIEESGLFEDIPYSVIRLGRYFIPEDMDTDGRKIIESSVLYVNRVEYASMFDGAPPISYDELAESGKYLVGEKLAEYIGPEKSVSLTFYEEAIFCSEEEYNLLPPEEREKFTSQTDGNDETFFVYIPKYTIDFDLNREITVAKSRALIATLEQYENGAYSLFLDGVHFSDSIPCILSDPDDYYKALEFFEQNSIYFKDNSAHYRRLLAILASVDIAAAFFSALIALIAVVNMINILVTGILNHRGELAAMQCVGMTEKEMYKMTGIECLQYALTAGIAATAVCELLMLLTQKVLGVVMASGERDYFSSFVSFVQPLPIIVAASLCAFVIGITSSIISLRAMRKTSLVEQIRSVE